MIFGTGFCLKNFKCNYYGSIAKKEHRQNNLRQINTLVQTRKYYRHIIQVIVTIEEFRSSSCGYVQVYM